MLRVAFPVYTASHEIASHPIFINKEKPSITYQIKSLKLINLKLEDSTFSDASIFVNSLIPIAVENSNSSETTYYSPKFQQFISLEKDINDPKIQILPQLAKLDANELKITIEALEELENCSFYYHIRGLKCKYEGGDMKKSLEFLIKGGENHEYGSLMMLVRIYAESSEAQAYNTQVSHLKSLKYMIQVFRFYGLFEQYFFKDSTIPHIHLFYIYLDCFPDFFTLVKHITRNYSNDPNKLEIQNKVWDELLDNFGLTSQQKEEIRTAMTLLLGILIETDPYSENVILNLQKMEIIYKRKENYLVSFLLGELYDAVFYGVSHAADFDKRLHYYNRADQQGHSTACCRLAVLTENLERYNQHKGIAQPAKMLYSASLYKKLEKTHTTEYLLHEAGQSLKTLTNPDEIDKSLKMHRTLYYLQDSKSILNYFRLLKLKKSPEVIGVARKMKKLNLPFYQIPLAFCYEKGRGTTKDFSTALKLYLDVFNKQVTKRPKDPKNFIFYRMGCLCLCSDELKGYSPIFFNLAMSELLTILRKKPSEPGSLYDLGKMIEKGRGAIQDIRVAGSIYRWILCMPHQTSSENFVHLYSQKRIRFLYDKYEVSTDQMTLFKVPDGIKAENEAAMLKLLDNLEANLGDSKSDINAMTENGTLRKIVNDILSNAFMKLGGLSPFRIDSLDHSTSNWKSTGHLDFPETLEEIVQEDGEYTKKSHEETEVNSGTPGKRESVNLNLATMTSPGKKSTFFKKELNLQRSIDKLKDQDKDPLDISGNASLRSFFSQGTLPFSLRKPKTSTIFREGMTIGARIFRILNMHKQKNYEKLKDYLSISPAGQKKISTVKGLPQDAISKRHILALTQEMLAFISTETNLLTLDKDKFAFEEELEEFSVKKRYPTAILKSNSQRFSFVSLDFSSQRLLNNLIEQPVSLHLALSFMHPYITPYYGICLNLLDENAQIGLLMEEVTQNLEDYCLAKPKITTIDRAQVCLRLAYILDAIHLLGLTHFSLNGKSIHRNGAGHFKLSNPLNLFFEETESIKIVTVSDQIAPSEEFRDKSHEEPEYIGSFDYFAPDFFRPNAKVSHQSDLFSLGVLMYLVFTGTKLYSFSEFSSAQEFTDKVKSGFLRERIKSAALLPEAIEKLILSCVQFHKKKRPSTTEIIQELKKFIVQISQHHTGIVKIPEMTPEFNIRSQYEALRFKAFGANNILLPGNFIYKGQMENGLPEGVGELTFSNEISYKGSFKEGLFHGKGVLTLMKREEIFEGEFAEGYPIDGIYRSDSLYYEYYLESQSWIPEEECLMKMVKGPYANPFQKEWKKIQQVSRYLFSDQKNCDIIKSFLELMYNYKKGDKLEHFDLFGNHYLCEVNHQNSPSFSSEIFLRSSRFFMREWRLYSPSINKRIILNADPTYIELAWIEKESEAVAISNTFDEVARYYHFGYKFLGSLQRGRPGKGIFFINFASYFTYNSQVKSYEGQSYMQHTEVLYEGDFYANSAEGRGLEYKNSMKKYEGEYRKGQPEGKGIFFNDKGKIEFKGLLKAGKPIFGVLYEENRIYEGKLTYYEVMPKESSSILKTKEEESQQQPPQLPPIKTFFEGTVYNFSQTIRELSGAFYLEEKKFDGIFRICYNDGSIYYGEMRNGIRKGKGTFTMSNGNIFEGVWDDQRLNGKIKWGPENNPIEISEGEFIRESSGPISIINIGRLKYRNGDVFEGQLRNGKLDGFGVFFYKKGSVYEGEFSQNNKCGLGKYSYFKWGSHWCFLGEYSQGRREGFGKLYKNDRLYFAGEWKNDFAVFGELYSEKDHVYRGEVEGDGELVEITASGFGKMILENGISFEGMFFDNRPARDCEGHLASRNAWEYNGEVNLAYHPHGFGMMNYFKNPILKGYLGIFKDGVKSQIGRFIYKNKDKYEGEVNNDLRHGVGVLIKGNMIFKGDWKINVKSGRGMILKIGFEDDPKKFKAKYLKGSVARAFYERFDI